LLTHNNILHWPVILTVCCIFLASCQSSVRFAKNDSPFIEQHQTNYTLQPSSDIVEEARDWLGTPYCYGGKSTKCADCSGFVQSVYRKCGKIIPRTAAEQYKASRRIAGSDANPGDLVFFSKGKRISHVGIFTGNNCVIHASTSKGIVVQELTDSYLSKTFVGYGRF